MRRLRHPIFGQIVLPILIGLAVLYLGHIIIKPTEDNSMTDLEIVRLVHFRIGIGQFWFDEGKRAYGSLV